MAIDLKALAAAAKPTAARTRSAGGRTMTDEAQKVIMATFKQVGSQSFELPLVDGLAFFGFDPAEVRKTGKPSDPAGQLIHIVKHRLFTDGKPTGFRVSVRAERGEGKPTPVEQKNAKIVFTIGDYTVKAGEGKKRTKKSAPA